MTINQENLNSPLENLIDFIARVPEGFSIAGLDVGTKTIGIGISDTNKVVATPHKTIIRSRFSKDAKVILAIEQDWGIGGYIIGLPKNMDGTLGPKVQSVQAFAHNFCQYTTKPVSFWDERLSSVSAEKYLIESNTSRKKRAKQIDNIAASLILQTALDYFRYQKDLR